MREQEISISDLITDRHSQVKKSMRTQHEGVYKKLEAVGKKKGTNIVSQWARSISNQINLCGQGNVELVRQKWT
ncbi:hypothetical protein CHS0354_037302, partial [Potamilus streckersoni]